MAKQPQKPTGAKSAPTTGTVPYPSNWGQMDHAARHEWMRQNRPGRNTAAPAPAPQNDKPAPRPAPAPPAAPPEGAVPVKLRVARWRVQVGDREPVECESHELGQRIADEMQAFENDHQEPAAPEYPQEPEDGDDDF